MLIAISSGSSSSAVSRGQQSLDSHPAGYRAVRPRPPCDREIRDGQLIADLPEVHRKNYSVYGVLKMHQAMKRRG